MSHKRSFLEHGIDMDNFVNNAIAGSDLSAIDKLAVRSAVSALQMLRLVGSDLKRPIEALTHEDLIEWIRSK
jgi:hypothetical protein